MQMSFNFETTDLRKSSIIGEPATQLPYGRKPRPVMTTDGLPIGTQARFIASAMIAAETGFPLNRLLTIRWISLFSANDVNMLRSLLVPARIDYLVELLRKWLLRNGCAKHYIWAREAAGSAGEHWHIAFCGTKKTDTALSNYIAKLTGEPRAPRKRGAPQLTNGEFACGECASWHLARDTQPDRRGYFLAAYLGKGEPSQRVYRGQLRDNTKKPVRGTSFGGAQPDGRYDSVQGLIEGTAHRQDRFFISKSLQRTKKKTEASHAPLVSQQMSNIVRRTKRVEKKARLPGQVTSSEQLRLPQKITCNDHAMRTVSGI